MTAAAEDVPAQAATAPGRGPVGGPSGVMESDQPAGSCRSSPLAIGYLLVPIVIMIVFSFNDPPGRNFVWGEFSLDAWLNPLRPAGPAEALGTASCIALDLDDRRDGPGHAHRARAGPLPVPRSAGTNLFIFIPMATPEIVLGASLLTMFVATRRPTVVLPAQHRHDPHRPHHVLHQLRGRDRAGPHPGLPAPPRGGRDGPRRQRVDDVLEGDLPAHPAGHPGGGPAGVLPVDRRLHRHELHLGHPDLPDLGLGQHRERPARPRSTSSARSSSWSRSGSSCTLVDRSEPRSAIARQAACGGAATPGGPR